MLKLTKTISIPIKLIEASILLHVIACIFVYYIGIYLCIDIADVLRAYMY